MTITNQNNVVIFQGNEVTTVFPFSFEVPGSSNMFVRLLDAVTNAVLETLAPGTYSVTGFGNPTGGNVTYPLVGPPLAADKKILIERIMPYTQDMDIQNEGGFYPDVIEDQLDKMVMQVQQIAERQNRSVLANPGIPGQTIPTPENDKVLGWNAGVLSNISPAEFINDAGFATAAQGAKADTAVQPGAPLLAALEAIIPLLPTSLPGTANKLWNNGGVISIS